MLLDSNQIIYSSQTQFISLRNFITIHATACSAISVAEVLGFHRLSAVDRQYFETFFNQIHIFPIDDAVIFKAVDLRQQRKLDLGDAFIAATALLNGLPLLTNNTQDFHWITGLKAINPLAKP